MSLQDDLEKKLKEASMSTRRSNGSITTGKSPARTKKGLSWMGAVETDRQCVYVDGATNGHWIA